MRQFLLHLLLPSESNNFRAKALHFEFFAGYIFLLLAPFVIFTALLFTKPGILGIVSFFDPGEIITKTNQARTKTGMPQLLVNPQLSQAAQRKADDMVTRGYWAHYAPDRKSPWDFVREAGYNFVAAGENLAKDFDNIDPIIAAWLASPSHAENLLSSNFTEIGVGTATGVVSGKTTTVVVQMFGKPQVAHLARTPEQAKEPSPQIAAKPAQVRTVLEGQPIVGPKDQLNQPRKNQIIDVRELVKPNVLNYFTPAKTVSLTITALIFALFLADFAFVRLTKITRTRGHPVFHLLILVIVLFAIWYSNSGLIL